MKYSGKINLAKLKKAKLINIKGNSATKLCVVIPVEDNHLFVSEKGGVFLDLVAHEVDPSQYGNTHILTQNFPKEVYEKMNDEERKNQPILGSLKELPDSAAKAAETAPTVEGSTVTDDDLPF